MTVGRGLNCGVKLSDPGVSRVHCRLITDPHGVRLEDANSRFGTLVNRRAVVAQRLISGDTIEIGDTTLRLSDDRAPEIETILPARLTDVARVEDLDESITAKASNLPPRFCHEADAIQLVGKTFVRFQIRSIVGQGPSGVLYRALDTVHNRSVALRLFWPALFPDDQAMSRFLRSMRAMVPLQHEHLINLYTAGRSSGLCYTAAEFIPGESVAQMISRIGIAGMLEWRTTWRIAIGLTKALAYLHKQQILHRCLRPSNISIRQGDQCVKLGDSLLAKSLDQLGQPTLTSRGDLVGDLHYSPPEQLIDASRVDQRADLYSLGATLYALLTGRPPFVGNTSEVTRQILAVSPTPPKQIHLGIPATFEGLVLRLLEKRLEDRYVDADMLLKELLRIGKYEGLAD